MYAINSHSYTHLILALGIVREPTVWVFITSQYPGIHDIRLATYDIVHHGVRHEWTMLVPGSVLSYMRTLAPYTLSVSQRVVVRAATQATSRKTTCKSPRKREKRGEGDVQQQQR